MKEFIAMLIVFSLILLCGSLALFISMLMSGIKDDDSDNLKLSYIGLICLIFFICNTVALAYSYEKLYDKPNTEVISNENE